MRTRLQAHHLPRRLAAPLALLLTAACVTSPPRQGTMVTAPGQRSPASTGAAASAPSVIRLTADDQDAAERPDGLDGVLHDVTHGDVYVNFRARYEDVAQEGIPKDAHATTLRSVLGYRTRPVAGITALLEIEDVSAYDARRYNSTVNGRTDRPVVADPEGTEVNQAYLERSFVDSVRVRAGRQQIVHANARFLGDVIWRQNQQTYDGVSAHAELGDDVILQYAWIDNANRIFGEDHPAGDARQNSHVLHARADLGEDAAASGYWYHLDFDQDSALVGQSTQTLGARYDGTVELGSDTSLTYALEAAKQRDTGHNPADVDSNYWRAEATAPVGPVDVSIGRELLQGSRSGTDRFTTPLATLHAFNGWADLFLNTPGPGLVDTFFSVGRKLGDDHKVLAVYHDFTAEATARDYGWEIDLLLTGKASETSRYGLKFADYHAQDFGVDVRKTWIWWQFGT